MRLRKRGGLARLGVLGLGSAALAPWASCGGEAQPPGPAPAPGSNTEASRGAALPYSFRDATAASGLAAFRQVNGTPDKQFVVESFGAGVALFDVENDGDLDAYLTNGSKLEGLAAGAEPRDALFLNDGKARFTDGTSAAGLGDARWTYGVRTVDLDSDGDVEMYLTNYGPNVLYDNGGDGTFADVTERAGVGDPRWSAGAAFFDFEKDGDLDLFVANYVEFDEETMLRERPRGTMHGHHQTSAAGQRLEDIVVMKGPMGLPGARNRFYRNQGDARFHDASEEVGITEPAAFSFQVLAFDGDLDGWLDVLVVTDVEPDLFWHNEAGRRFEELALRVGCAVRADGVPQGGMGACLGDYDGDLFPDLFVSNFVEDYSTLFRGAAGGFFTDVTARMGLRQPTWPMVGWGCGFVDFDSDGDHELFQINGHTYPQVDLLDLGTSYEQKNQLWELAGGKYVEPRGAGGPGFAEARAGRGSALGDVDADGDVDLLVGNLDEPPTLLLNEGPQGNWLRVLVVGPEGNRDAIGARIVLRVGERRDLRLIGNGSGFLSSNAPEEPFGLASAPRADALTVTWPDGRTSEFTDLAAGKLYVVEDRGAAEPAGIDAR